MAQAMNDAGASGLLAVEMERRWPVQPTVVPGANGERLMVGRGYTVVDWDRGRVRRAYTLAGRVNRVIEADGRGRYVDESRESPR